MPSHNHHKTPKITTPNARRTLEPKGKPYWQLIDTGLYLGYRKRKTGGTWIARRFNKDRKYEEKKIGLADDQEKEDGITTLCYSQAQKAVWSWHKTAQRIEEGIEDKPKGPYSVKDAMNDYLEHYKANGKAYGDTKKRIDNYILPKLGHHEVIKLTTKQIKAWLNNLANTPAQLRTGKTAKKANFREEMDDEAKRKRKATANRILTVLKAGLNHAWNEGVVPNDANWRRVKPFKDVDHPKVRYLTKEESVRLVNACSEDLRLIVKGALYTGCRYSELARLTVNDYNPDTETIFVAAAKTNKSRHVTLNDEGKTFYEKAILGKKGSERIFTKKDGNVWGKSHQDRPFKDACKNGRIEPAASFNVLRHTHASHLAMQGTPMAVIAKQLGHSDTRMTEKHYAHLSPSYIGETIRQNMPVFGIEEETNIKKLKAGSK